VSADRLTAVSGSAAQQGNRRRLVTRGLAGASAERPDRHHDPSTGGSTGFLALGPPVGTPAALAAKNATVTIPVIIVGVGDPVAQGVVASLVHPFAWMLGLSGVPLGRCARWHRTLGLSNVDPETCYVASPLGDNMGLADDIRWKVDARVLPRGTPDNVSARRGDGQQCNAFDDLISTGQVEYGVDLPGLGTLLFHAGCFGLWEAELLRRGLLKQPVPRR
jgi:hypothetical protein